MKKVYYFSDWEEGFSSLNKAIVGDGFEDIERAADIWKIKKDVDLWVFPDVQHSGLQLELESQGYAVWGSREGDSLELDREYFLDTLKEVGLDVPPYEVIVGITSLRKFLKNKEDYYIKVSLFRGSFETEHWEDWDTDNGKLDGWAVRFGRAKEQIRFLCFPSIDTPLEIGGDTYCVDGKWPSLMLHGIEWKDRSYFGSVTAYKDMPEQLREVMEAFGPVLAGYRYRNQWSMEDRVKDDKHHYFIDATCRMGLPSTASQLELWNNIPDIFWHGAHGELVEPKPAGKFCVESILTMKGDHSEWRVTEIDKDLVQWVKFADCCEVDGKLCFPSSDSPGGDDIGWLVSIGDTPEEAIATQNKHADMLPDSMDANTECLAYVLKEIHEEEKKGIEFSKQEIPEPEIVMQD
jgi:hypothetical protein